MSGFLWVLDVCDLIEDRNILDVFGNRRILDRCIHLCLDDERVVTGREATTSNPNPNQGRLGLYEGETLEQSALPGGRKRLTRDFRRTRRAGTIETRGPNGPSIIHPSIQPPTWSSQALELSGGLDVGFGGQGEAASLGYALTQQGDVPLESLGVPGEAQDLSPCLSQRRGLILGAPRKARAQEVADGSVTALLPALRRGGAK